MPAESWQHGLRSQREHQARRLERQDRRALDPRHAAPAFRILVTPRRSGSSERSLHAAVEETRLHRVGRVCVDGGGDRALAPEASRRECGGSARRFAPPTGKGRVSMTREIFLEVT
jgi:hypothetical protein